MPETKRPLKVFLCHASADKPKVRELYRTLKRRGVQPWLDAENLIPGQNWEVEIPKAIFSSDAIIICLSPNSIDKEGYVQKEIKFALDKALEMPEGRIFLIPAKLEDCDLPFSLRQYQAVNLYEKEGYARLMKALKLRASQLERNTVELPKEGEVIPEIKKVVEDKKPVEPKQEKSQTKTFEQSHEPSLQGVDIGGFNITGGENVINIGIQEQPEPAKLTTKKSQPRNTKSPRKPSTTIIVALIGLAGTVIAALLGSPIIEKWFSPAPVATEMVTATFTLTSQPIALSQTLEPTQISRTPTMTITPTASFTPPATSLPTEITDAKGVSMMLVPAGEFVIGSEEGDADEKPVREVYLDAFYMDKYEVTNSLYEACVDSGVCKLPELSKDFDGRKYYGNAQFEDYPVTYIDWNQADMYCSWRGAKLPTEAQWEKAARGTDGRTFPWGEAINCNLANYNPSCVGGMKKVGSYESGKSLYGIYDLAGNVWEWVADWYSPTSYQNFPISNPLGAENGEFRILRGGAWNAEMSKTRASYRFELSSIYYYEEFNSTLWPPWAPTPSANFAYYAGFRCAKETNP